MYPNEKVSEDLPPKPFREESALETKDQGSKITTAPSRKNCAFCQFLCSGPGLGREGVNKEE